MKNKKYKNPIYNSIWLCILKKKKKKSIFKIEKKVYFQIAAHRVFFQIHKKNCVFTLQFFTTHFTGYQNSCSHYATFKFHCFSSKCTFFQIVDLFFERILSKTFLFFSSVLLLYRGEITFAEVDCQGPGASMSKRVKWVKTLSSEELEQLVTPELFIDQGNWLGRQLGFV